jgi:hypothetical protein
LLTTTQKSECHKLVLGDRTPGAHPKGGRKTAFSVPASRMLWWWTGGLMRPSLRLCACLKRSKIPNLMGKPSLDNGKETPVGKKLLVNGKFRVADIHTVGLRAFVV